MTYITQEQIADSLGYKCLRSFKSSKNIHKQIEKIVNIVVANVKKEQQNNLNLFIKDLNTSLKEHLKKE